MTAETAERNDVTLAGRLTAPAEERTLPSGDTLVTFRVVTARPPRKGSRAPAVDAIDCTAWNGPVRKKVLSWEAGDVVEVQGSLRRRFWRGAGGGAASRTEVEVVKAQRLAKAPQ